MKNDHKFICAFFSLLKSVLGAHFVNVRLWAGKMNTSNVLLQYIFLRSSEVDICENSDFFSRGQAIRRFFISDGLHLATLGTSLFVANIKFWLRKTLHIRFENFQRNESVQNYRHTHNQHTGSPSKSGRLIDGYNYMYDTYDSFGGEHTQSRRRQYTNRYMYRKPMSRYDRN